MLTAEVGNLWGPPFSCNGKGSLSVAVYEDEWGHSLFWGNHGNGPAAESTLALPLSFYFLLIVLGSANVSGSALARGRRRVIKATIVFLVPHSTQRTIYFAIVSMFYYLSNVL